MQTEKSQTEKTQGMRFRNHISIIAEQTGGLLIALQFAVWSKTYISLQDNAVVIERNTLNKKKNTIGIRNISKIVLVCSASVILTSQAI